MKIIHARVNKDCDAYIYSTKELGYTCIFAAKYGSTAISNASPERLRQYLLSRNPDIQIPDDFMDSLTRIVQSNRRIEEWRK